MLKGAEQETTTARDDGAITSITVCGYKSIGEERSIDVRPLTILAGANSSGKSSIMQPLLLMKQTLEASYDPGALLLNGPNVRFTSAEQLLSRPSRCARADLFYVGTGTRSGSLTTYFRKEPSKGFDIERMVFKSAKDMTTLRIGMTHDEIMSMLPRGLKKLPDAIVERDKSKPEWVVSRNRCFLELGLRLRDEKEGHVVFGGITPSTATEACIRGLVHLPGLRGNPERTYPVTAVGSTFPGTFEKYVASVIAQWQAGKEDGKLEEISKHLAKLGLTWKVTAKPVNDTQVELQVGRLTHAARGGARDLVNIADVGFGVSQTLPVIVALLAAQPGQLVYLEQPEIHLHPRAQAALAWVLAEAANRGVRVVAETHSSLLLQAVQFLVAEGAIPVEKVILHWFKRRDSDGITEVTSATLDEAGAYGDWPEDFADVSLEAQGRYLDAAESRLRRG